MPSHNNFPVTRSTSMCVECNTRMDGNANPRDGLGYCPNCGWSKQYRGVPRESLCLTCIHNEGLKSYSTSQTPSLCSEGLWKNEDGFWVDAKARAIIHTIQPKKMQPQWNCSGYRRRLPLGMNKEEQRLFDPERYYKL